MPSEPTAAPAAPSKSTVFFRRLISSVILWAIVIGAIFSGNKVLSDYVFLVILLLLTGFGLHEFYTMLEKRGWGCFKWSGLSGGLLLVASTFTYISGAFFPVSEPALAQANDFEVGLLILFVLGLCVRQFFSFGSPSGLLAISTTLFGLMYVPWLLNFIQKINFFPHVEGQFYILYFILVTKFSDLGAYVTGSLIGKHKMIPRISPNKTWEGFIGAIAISTLASVLFAHFARDHMAGMNIRHAVVLGILLSVTAVVGDLVESLFKRETGVKDSGRLFPGIGGILDLIDSLLFNAPLMYLYLRLVLAPVPV